MIPFFQTVGIALFIGLKLFCFRACSQLIQDYENDPTSFAQSLESRVFRSQWRYFLKKGLDVFKDKRRVCLFLLGFFSLILCLTYGSVLVSQYDIFFSWKNLFIKDPGRGPMVFLAVLTFVPVLIYATKEISPDNGWPNYFAAFTRRPFWRITHFLARVILLSAFLIFMPIVQEQIPIVQEQINFKAKLYLFAFVSLFSVMPCLNLALRRDAFLQINLDFLLIFMAPMPVLVVTILEFCQIWDYRGIHSLYERIFTLTSFQDALFVSSMAVGVAGFFLYYFSFICQAYQDYLYLDNKGYTAYKRSIIARKRAQKRGGDMTPPPLLSTS